MRRLLGSLAGFALGTLAVLLLLEGALRLLRFPTASTMVDRTVGVRWRPGASYRWNLEGFSQGRINAAGWRDRDYAIEKPESTYRVLVLGDSYVQGMEVPLDSTFHKRLERAFAARARPGRRVEVMALGRGGFGTTDELLTYRRWGRAYDPDLVLLVFVLNDWADNVPWPGTGWTRPYLVLDGDSLRLDTTFVSTGRFRRLQWLSWWKEHSSLANLAATSLQTMRARTRPTVMEQGLTKAGGWHTSWNFDRSPAADSVPAMRLTARILGRLADEVRRDGHRFLLVTTGTCEIEAVEFLAERAADPNFDPDKTVRFLEETAHRYDFEVLHTAPVYRRWYAAGGPRPAYGEGRRYGHWNSLGHSLAARTLFDFLAPGIPGLELPPGPDSARARPASQFGQSQPNVPPVSSP